MTSTELQSSTKWLLPSEQRELCRALAIGEVKRSALARQFGVSASAVTQFAKRHAREIDAIRDHMDDEFAGLWIAQKEQRVAAYQADYQRSLDHPRADHFEHIRTRTQIQQAVAEELGQLPTRTQVTVLPVVHVIEGVDLGALT